MIIKVLTARDRVENIGDIVIRIQNVETWYPDNNRWLTEQDAPPNLWQRHRIFCGEAQRRWVVGDGVGLRQTNVRNVSFEFPLPFALFSICLEIEVALGGWDGLVATVETKSSCFIWSLDSTRAFRHHRRVIWLQLRHQAIDFVVKRYSDPTAYEIDQLEKRTCGRWTWLW